MQTAIVRYSKTGANGKTPEGNVEVDLVGAVHIGDVAYYEQLNEYFKKYDALLYELVAPQGTRIPKGGKRETGNPLALLQQMMKGIHF